MRLLEVTTTWLRDALAGWSGLEHPPAPVPTAPPAAARTPPPGLVQPDRTTCGSASLVVARLLGDATYAGWLASGEVAGRAPDARTAARRFADEVLATHARTSRWSDAAGRRRIGWPRALGTTPWAVARELTATGGTAPVGTPHRVLAISPRHRSRAYAAVLATVARGHAVPLFVGNRLLPRHVVLAFAGDERALTAYDPATGRSVRLPRDDFSRGALRVSGWCEPWFAVVPVSGRLAA